ncbi:MAG: cell surface protein [Opitutaceae bacterium]|nr:cell surface protein [Opitutaceae bacterium]
MQTTRISLARRILLCLGTALGLVLLPGCKFALTNLTPNSLPENPSQIYTLQLRVTQKGPGVVAGSVVPHIIIDGQNYKMVKSPLGADIYEFDYQLPSGRDEMAYYYLVNYRVENTGRQYDQEAYTDILRTKIVHRYVLSLEAARGPVGARISVVGRGFTAQDVIYVSNTATRTVFESPNSLSFFVPALEPSKNYPVTIGSATGSTPVGTFRIDPSNVQVIPGSLALRTGERQSLTFTVPIAAPAGGLLLDITTDLPEGVIMPEVVIPAGQNTVTVFVEGGKAGSGSLFLKGYGGGEVTIPVAVSAK